MMQLISRVNDRNLLSFQTTRLYNVIIMSTVVYSLIRLSAKYFLPDSFIHSEYEIIDLQIFYTDLFLLLLLEETFEVPEKPIQVIRDRYIACFDVT